MHLRGVELNGLDLANQKLAGATLERCLLKDCRLTGIDLSSSRIRDVTFERCRMDLANLAFAKIDRTLLADCVLTDAFLEDSDLQGVELRGCELRGVRATDLRGTKMPLEDILGLAPALAAALGIALTDAH